MNMTVRFFRFYVLLTALIVINSHIMTGIYYIFLKNVLDQTWKGFDTKFEKLRKIVIK